MGEWATPTLPRLVGGSEAGITTADTHGSIPPPPTQVLGKSTPPSPLRKHGLV